MPGDGRPAPRSTVLVCADLGQAWCAVLSGSRVVELRLARDDGPISEGALVAARILDVDGVTGACRLDVGAARPAMARRRAGERTIAPGDVRIVQIAHRGRDGKGARATFGVRLAGWSVVLLPGGDGVRVSRRVRDADERDALARRVAAAAGPARERFGLVARAAAAHVDGEALAREIAALAEAWDAALGSAEREGAPAVVRPAVPAALRLALRHGVRPGDRLVCDDAHTGDALAGAGRAAGTGLWAEPVVHAGRAPAFEGFGLDRALERALASTLALPGGGRLQLHELEPMTVADVDAGRDGRGPLAVDLEAAAELARQARLRNLGGLVVADFVDPATVADGRRIDAALAEHLAEDPARPRALAMSAFGLVELTRPRRGPSLLGALGARCPSCGGGAVLPARERARALLRRARREAGGRTGETVVVTAPGAVLDEARTLAATHGPRGGLPDALTIEWREGDDAVRRDASRRGGGL